MNAGTTVGIGIACWVVALSAHAAPAKDPADAKAAKLQWSGTTVAGEAVQVPDARRVSVVVFVRTDQQRSHEALAQARAVLKNVPAKEPVQAVVVVSGEGSADRARQLRDSGECPWPAVADPDYAAADRMAVRVWPTTLLVRPGGEVAAHLAGLPKTFARDLESHLAFAAGRIDAAALKEQLNGSGAVVDDAQQMARRHLQVATLLLGKGMTDKAREELAAALRLRPESPALRLDLARALVALGDAEAALVLLDATTLSAIAPAQARLVRGSAHLRLGQWDLARDELQRATRLNPKPAEAWYRLGLVYDHLNQPADAAAAFRKAYESTDAARESLFPPPPPADAPLQPAAATAPR